MKNLSLSKLLVCFSFILIFSNCQRSVTESSNMSQARLQQIASQYNYTVVPASNKPDTTVKTEAGLIHLLKQMNSGLNVPKTQSFGDTTKVDMALIESLKKN